MSEKNRERAQESENLLEISDLHVQYNTDDAVVHALNGLSLKVKKGAKLGLVGETGAGKTTLALSILRLLPARVGEITQGSIVYDKDNLLKQPESFMLGLAGGEDLHDLSGSHDQLKSYPHGGGSDFRGVGSAF